MMMTMMMLTIGWLQLWCFCRLSEEDDFMQDQEEMDPEIAAAYEQFLEEMMQNESCSWAVAAVS